MFRNILILLGCTLFALSIVTIANDRSYEIRSTVSSFARAEETTPLLEDILNNANVTDSNFVYVENATTLPEHNLKYVTISFTSIVTGAGLGNVLFEVFFLLTAASQLKLIPVYNSSITFDRLVDYPVLNNLFRNVNVSTFDVISLSHAGACCQYRPLNIKEFKKIQNVSGKSTLLITGSYFSISSQNITVYFHNNVFFHSFKYFSENRGVIRKLLKPTAKLMNGVEKEVNKIEKEYREKIRNKHVHKICIHIRRSDYQRNKIYWYTRSTFTLASANYLGEKYGINKSIAILAVGDSMDWANAVLSDLHDRNWTVAAFSRMDQAVTIALTQTYCDTLLLTAPTSTFGFWMAYTLKEGAHVYRGEDFSPPGGIEKQTAIDDVAPPEWKVLRFNQSTLQVRELV